MESVKAYSQAFRIRHHGPQSSIQIGESCVGQCARDRLLGGGGTGSQPLFFRSSSTTVPGFFSKASIDMVVCFRSFRF